MKTVWKYSLLALLGACAAGASAFYGLYHSRLQSIDSLQQLTSYQDGYNLYTMDIRYDYDLDAVIASDIHDDQSLIDAFVAEALPLLPIHIEAPHFGCTAFTLKTQDGHVYMGRNYDFKDDTSALFIRTAPKNGYRSIAFTALNNIAANAPEESFSKKLATLVAPFICLDGINEKGVSIAVLTLDSKPTRQHTGKPAIGTSLAIRLVLDRAATTEEAVKLLSGYDMLATAGRDYHFYITDASGDGRIVEYDCDSADRRFVATPAPAITNFFYLYKDKVLPHQKNGIYGHGKERYDAVLDVFAKDSGVESADTGWHALRAAAQDPNPNDITSNTQWSILYDNTDLSADIAIRRHWDDVHHFTL